MEAIKGQIKTNKKSQFKFLENLEGRQLLSVGAFADENPDNVVFDGDGLGMLGDVKFPVMCAMNVSMPVSQEVVNEERQCLVDEGEGSGDMYLDQGVSDGLRYAVTTVLKSLASSREDDAFVRAESVVDGQFQWNSGWTRSAVISMASEFLADELAEGSEGKASRMEKITEFLTALPFGLVGLYVMQHASSTTSVKNLVGSDEVTLKPFTAWFVGGSLLGSAIAMLPELYHHWQRGEVIDVTPTMKAIHHDWEAQGSEIALMDMPPNVDVYKLSTLAGEIVFLGLTAMMGNRAHEEGGVLVKDDAPFYKFAYNAQYHFNYSFLRLFETIAEKLRDQYTGQRHQESVGGMLLREMGTYVYMTSVYFGSITSFFVPANSKSTYAMKVYRALAIHAGGSLVRDVIHRLADWYEQQA